MKKIVMLVFLCAVLFSCSQEDVSGGKEQGDAAVRLSMNGGSVSRSADLPAADLENKVSFLNLYVFEKGGYETPAALKYKIRLADRELGSTGDGGYSATFYLKQAGNYHFEAIANSEIEIETGASFADFCAKQTPDRSGDGLLVMQGAVDLDVKIGSNDLSVDLVRLDARIDLANTAIGFTLQSVRLLRSARYSKYVPLQEVPADRIETGSWVELEEQPIVNQFFSQLYTYENGTAGETCVEITGKYKGADYQCVVPFEGVVIERNHRYLVNIKNITTTTVEADIHVADWNPSIDLPFDPVDGKGLRVTVDDDRTVPSTDQHMVGMPNPAVYGSGEYEGTEPVVVQVETDGAYVLHFLLESSNLAAEIVAPAPVEWLTVAPAAPHSRAVYLMQQYVDVTLAPNTGIQAREAVVVARHKLEPSVCITYKIIQAGKKEVVNPLDNWAETNLKSRVSGGAFTNYQPTESDVRNSSSGTLVQQGLDWREAPFVSGGVFQFGRNYGFLPYDDVTIEVERYFWNQQADDIAEAMGYANSLIQGYRDWVNPAPAESGWLDRTAGKDPCPAGYRLPTRAEYAEILPSPALDLDDRISRYQKGDANSRNMKLGAEVKQAGTDQAVALLWLADPRVWGYPGGGQTVAQITIKVLCVPVGKEITTVDVDSPLFTDVIDRDFEQLTAKGKEVKAAVRFFPANGKRPFNDRNGTYGQTISMTNWGWRGYYWSSKSDLTGDYNKGAVMQFGSVSYQFNLQTGAQPYSDACAVRCVKETK